MGKPEWYLILFFLLTGCGAANLSDATVDNIKPDFEDTKIEKGLFWHQWQPDDLYGSPQQIFVLEVWKKRTLEMIYDQSNRSGVRQFAEQQNALAAVSAGRFDPQEDELTYVKIDWARPYPADESLASGTTETPEGVLAISFRDRARIEEAKPARYYQLADDYQSVLFTGPLLLQEGKVQSEYDDPNAGERLTRTCACETEKDRLFLISIGAGQPDARGLTLRETAHTLQAIGCRRAVHLSSGTDSEIFVRGRENRITPDNSTQRSRENDEGVSIVLVVK